MVPGAGVNSKVICDGIGRIDPSVGVAVITRDFTVKWANKAHLKRWPRLKGKVCYKYVNGFARPCEWCPVKKTFQDRKMHDELVCSPNTKEEDKKWDIVFSNIVSVPVFGEDGEVKEVVEAVFDNTSREKDEMEKRASRYSTFREFGDILERLESPDYVPDYLLLGAVWSECLSFPSAGVFIFGGGECETMTSVRQLRTIKKKDCEDVIRKFEALLSQKAATGRALSGLRGALSRAVGWEDFPQHERCTIEEAVANKYGIKRDLVEKRLALGRPATRLAPNLVATSMLGHGEEANYLLVTVTSETQHDLTTDRDMLDVEIFGSVMQGALRTRQMVTNVTSVLSKAEPLVAAVEEDAGALIFAGSIVSSFAHDLLTSCKRMENQIDYIWAGIKRSEQVHLVSYREIATKEIQFMRGCLSRAIDVARMNKIEKRHFVEADINKIIREVEVSSRKLFDDNKIEFRFSSKTDDSCLLCEPLLIKQVLSNLVVNACASLANTRYRVREVVVRTERNLGFFRIIVEDNGLGIDPSIIEMIWRPFFSTKSGKGVGTGLGLMICKRIVEDIHGGTIGVRSKHGYGATFTVSLPTSYQC